VLDGTISPDDPRAPDVRALLDRHLAFTHEHSPPEDVHALDINGLLDSDVLFFSFRHRGKLLGVGALKLLDAQHVEVKSMHTAEGARGQGVGRAMVDHMISIARMRGVERVSLETGTMAAFAPARSLYAQAGFKPCEPFGAYLPSPNSTFMTVWLEGESSAG
jgi:putative acetyltransferase